MRREGWKIAKSKRDRMRDKSRKMGEEREGTRKQRH